MLNLKKEAYLERIQETKFLPDIFDKVNFLQDLVKDLEIEQMYSQEIESYIMCTHDICKYNCSICPWSMLKDTVDSKDWMYTNKYGIYLNIHKKLCEGMFPEDEYNGDIQEIIETLEWVISNLK